MDSEGTGGYDNETIDDDTRDDDNGTIDDDMRCDDDGAVDEESEQMDGSIMLD